MTQAQLARKLGVTQRSVAEAIETGRIVLNADGSLPDDAEKQFNDNTDPVRSMNGRKLGGKKSSAEPASFMSVKIRKETAAAQLKEIELAKERNKLLEKEAVKEAVFKWARTIRDAVLAIPDRVAADLAAQILAMNSTGKKLSANEIERIVRQAWAKESRAVLVAIEKTPKPKNKKRDESEA
jgi:hypothetical protein